MKIYTPEQIDKMFSESDHFEEFKAFINECSLQDELTNITSNHTKKRLETIIALAENPKKCDLCETLLCKLKDAKKNAEHIQTLKEFYGNAEIVEESDLKDLYNELRNFLKNYKKHDNVQKHEERIATKWIKDLTRIEPSIQKVR